MPYETVITSVENNVGLITLNRPQALNALSAKLSAELADALTEFLQDAEVRCIVITGNEKAFSAGADIKEMGPRQSTDMLDRFTSSIWTLLRRARKPVIAAVSGHCYGGGCELALACDMIVASETAKFGQPEINIGIIPGAGGTQRWTRIVGKARAMEIVLTGKPISAQQAMAWGVVNRVAPVETYLSEAKRLAAEIAAQPPVAARMAKEAVIKAEDLTLENGLDFESRLFAMLFSTEDQKEGARAFVEKRKPIWKGR
ncbi:MAG: enoyl-CoA hydratase/isomerase family protein [Chloroflexi bacterium]|nr:enoyl-CoA hydratase/isomerase family protein [Chloroflexota bacterium]MBI3733842.1 enoyl-CoA hydratase/isomerase family protein [Chloroflexota bacterium]